MANWELAIILSISIIVATCYLLFFLEMYDGQLAGSHTGGKKVVIEDKYNGYPLLKI